ncbi:VOC family protein [Saccharopolyspora sp. 5N708]|uniref:VOC family protein n=1 Tax=Saccharopolyspora sp. 5N708 TaxID=3457424 RepID=UPI003FD31133
MTQAATPIGLSQLPVRLHHNAWVTTDQEVTRQFYETVVGMPLVATWAEATEIDGEKVEYCHTFYAMKDGSALAFFQFAEQAHHDKLVPPPTPSMFRHVALAVDAAKKDAIKARVAETGIPAERTWEIDHGYCESLYVIDPNGLLLEFTVDTVDVEAVNEKRRAGAHEDLRRWLAGDHTPNNDVRH